VFEAAAEAPAKLNLSLDIIGRRADGYHDLRSVMQTLELADEVRVAFDAAQPEVVIDGPFACGVPADGSNLAWRAAEELARRIDHSLDGLRIALTKRIPVAGGLGGGASDAVATLRILQRAWDASDEDILSAALAIGSDEAFFLAGGTALVEGRGERVTRLLPWPHHAVVLFVPRVTLERKTAQLFAAVGEHPFDTGAATSQLLATDWRCLRSRDLSNGFERVAFSVFPGLELLRNEIEVSIGEQVRLCGAGPTLFWLGPPSDAERILGASANLDCEVIATATAKSSWAR